MATKRGTIIDTLKSLLESEIWELDLTTVSKQVEMIPTQNLQFDDFPIAHIVDKDELKQYLPGRMIRARIQPVIRLFYQDADYAALNTINEKIKIMFASGDGFPGGLAADYLRVKAIRTIKEPNHKFVEYRIELEISFRYRDGQP